MLCSFLDCLLGICVVKCDGRFPERILNSASNKGIYIQNVSRSKDGSMIFSVSRKGFMMLEKNVPDGLNISVIKRFGFPFFLKRYKKRIVLIFLPLFLIFASTLFSSFIWKVKISGGDEKLRELTSKVLRDNGVYTGALKHKIDQLDVKYKTIVSVNELSWLWVDIKGTTAYVEIRPRTPSPDMQEIKEPGDVISTESGIVEKAEIYRGRPLVNEGETVSEGDILVTGVITTDKENVPTYYHHANARIIVRTWKEKTFVIPRKNFIKTPTGNEKTVYSLIFKKNNINFSLNSGISYGEYDKIENNIKIPFLPIKLSRIKYCEVAVTETDNAIDKAATMHLKDFKEELEEKNYDVISVSSSFEEDASVIRLKVTAECLKDAAKEIPIQLIDKGDSNG